MFFAGAMACAAIHRVTFSVLAIPIREEFALSLPQMGILQSAVLAGYIVGQVGRGSPPLHMLCSPCFLTTRDIALYAKTGRHQSRLQTLWWEHQ